jgi:hypothetical protein
MSTYPWVLSLPTCRCVLARFGFSDRNMLVLRDDVRQQGFVSDRWGSTPCSSWQHMLCMLALAMAIVYEPTCPWALVCFPPPGDKGTKLNLPWKQNISLM